MVEELKTSVHQVTEQQEDPDRPIYRRWHQLGFCERLRKMRKHNLSRDPKFKFVVDPSSIKQINNGFTLNLSNSICPTDQYELKVLSSVKGIISLEFTDLQEAQPRFKLSNSGILNDYRMQFLDGKINRIDIAKQSKGQESQDDDQLVVSFSTRLCLPHGDLLTDTDESIHFEKHKFVIDIDPLKVHYYLNDQIQCTINSLNLLSLERTRKENSQLPTDSTIYDEEQSNLFQEKAWKGILEPMPYGPQAISLDICFPTYQKVFGIPERINSFQVKNTVEYETDDVTHENKITNEEEPFRLYTCDHFNDKYPNHSQYGAVPIMHLRADDKKQMLGLFWCNAADTFVDIIQVSQQDKFQKPTKYAHWMSETGHLQLFLYGGASPIVVLYKQALLTGFAPLPPNFVLGYHQCRWNYLTQAETEEVSENFKRYQIPCDSIWLDIEYTDGKRYYTWNKETFPNAKRMLENIKADGRKLVTIIDPHTKVDEDYWIYQEANQKRLNVRNLDGGDFQSECWPKESNWLDFLNKDTRDYLKQLYSTTPDGCKDSENYIWTDNAVMIWNDMNEPSCFSQNESTISKSSLHYFKPDSDQDEPEQIVEHRAVHNVYGLFNSIATSQALLERGKQHYRPFHLSRSFFAGSQRHYAAVWTADCRCDWQHFNVTVRQMLSTSIVGLPLLGSDVPGFYRNPCDDQIVVRWYQMGTMMPFFRAHAHRLTDRREPWTFSEEIREKIKNTIILRYQLLQYFAQQFFLHNTRGEPVLRPMWFNYPCQDGVNEIEDQFMIGNDIIVRPVLEKDATEIQVWLPAGEIWYNMFTRERIDGSGGYHTIQVTLDTFGLFARGGSIIPICQVTDSVRSTQDLQGKKFSLYIYLGSNARAKGFIYLNDGYSTLYQQGDHTLYEFEYDGKEIRSNQKLGKDLDIQSMIGSMELFA